MLSEFPFVYILYCVLAIVGIVAFFLNRYIKSKNITGKAKAMEILKFKIYLYFFMTTILWLSLPSTAVLSSFGYPFGTEDIATDNKLLHLLQEYNKAIVRTTEVLRWFIFFTGIWIISVFFSFIRNVKIKGEE